MFRTNFEVLSVPSIILTTFWSRFYNLIGPAHQYWHDRNGPIGALSDFAWLLALALSTLHILLICASGYIYGSGHVRLVRSCFIFGFMFIYSWEHRQYLSSLSQYIFCTFLWLKQEHFPPLIRTQKTSNLFSSIATFVPWHWHWHIRLSISYNFAIPLIIYWSSQTPSIFYLIRSLYTLDINIMSIRTYLETLS
jgi:hypothetical protein